MILDKMENLARYENMSPNMKTAVKFLRETDLEALPLGIHKIDGDEVYVNVQEYDTKPWVDGFFESHNSYIDIQCIYTGRELLSVADTADMNLTEDLFDEKDLGKYDDSVRGVDFVLNDGEFLMLFPNEAHRPQIESGGVSRVKKFVMKLKV